MIKSMFFLVAFYVNANGDNELRVLSGPHETLEEADMIRREYWQKRLEMNYFIAKINMHVEIIFHEAKD